MDSRKILLSAVAMFGISAQASAADLFPPPPPMPAGGAAVAELGTGWYLRGDIGYVDYSKPQDTPFGVAVPPLVHERLSNGWSAGAGIGYQLTSWLRADVTADVRNESKFYANSSRTNFIEGFSTDRAKFDSTTFLLNGYVDLGNWYGVTPYVGAGVGMAQNRLTSYTGQVTCIEASCGDPTPGASYPLGPQGLTFIPSKTDRNLAWALMAGAAIDVGSGFKIDLGYRYLNFGDARTGLDAFGVGTKLKNLDSQEVRIGARYMID
jgi:opacity protein-like surface antigen